MLVIVSYDINIISDGGAKRLRRAAKICMDYGQRVQNSVYECLVDAAELEMLRQKLLGVIDIELDSVRIYRLGNNHHNKVEHFGVKPSLDLEGPLIF